MGLGKAACRSLLRPISNQSGSIVPRSTTATLHFAGDSPAANCSNASMSWSVYRSALLAIQHVGEVDLVLKSRVLDVRGDDRWRASIRRTVARTPSTSA